MCFANDLPEGVSIAETNIYTTFIPAVIIRDKPDLSGNKIGLLTTGEEAEFLEESSNTTTIDYYGEKRTSTWVKLKKKDGTIGWLFKGLLHQISIYFDKMLDYRVKYPRDVSLKTQNVIVKNIGSQQVSLLILRSIEERSNETEEIIGLSPNKYDNDRSIKGKKITDSMYFGGSDLGNIDFIRSASFEKNNYKVEVMLFGSPNLVKISNWEFFYIYTFYSIDEFENTILSKITSSEKSKILKVFKKINGQYENILENMSFSEDKENDWNNVVKILNRINYPSGSPNIGVTWSNPGIFFEKLKNKKANGYAQEWFNMMDYMIQSLDF